MDTRYRDVLLRTFRAFIRLCQEERLTWYMAFGSAIGVARHSGMIPWDDDIDVLMPRADYERFIRLQCEGFRILHLSRTEGDLPFPYAKFCDASSTIWEMEKYPFVWGVFIDVFPLDSASEGAEGERFFQDYQAAWWDYVRSFRQLRPVSARERLVEAKDRLLYRPRRDSLRQRFLSLDAQADRPGKFYRVWCLEWTGRFLLPKEWFASSRLMPFEGMPVPLPIGNHELLTRIYGDYLTLPPVEERVSNHHHRFVDLDRALSFEEVKKLCK